MHEHPGKSEEKLRLLMAIFNDVHEATRNVVSPFSRTAVHSAACHKWQHAEAVQALATGDATVWLLASPYLPCRLQYTLH